MIKIENTVTPSLKQWMAVIRGMRNPMNSWEKSDSDIDVINKDDVDEGYDLIYGIKIGENDLELMKKLVKAGTDHRKFMRMIPIYADITAPLYWWTEQETYKVGTVSNSCSKMHKLLEKPFEINDFSLDQTFGYRNEVKQFRPIVDEQLEQHEIWKKYSDSYDISNYGRVRHNYKKHATIINGSLHKDGYIFVALHGKQSPVHRLVAKLFLGESNGREVNHIDGNKQNNFVTNLEWCTRSENQQHAVINHLQPRQVNTYRGKFTEEERNKIKEYYKDGEASMRGLAKIYNVSPTCIKDIVNDKYSYSIKENFFEDVAKPMVELFNKLRNMYLFEKDATKKKNIWWQIIQFLPSSYNQRRTVMLNYEVLANMYHARKNHKLDEWRDFCKWIETLPYSELITGE